MRYSNRSTKDQSKGSNHMMHCADFKDAAQYKFTFLQCMKVICRAYSKALLDYLMKTATGRDYYGEQIASIRSEA